MPLMPTDPDTKSDIAALCAESARLRRVARRSMRLLQAGLARLKEEAILARAHTDQAIVESTELLASTRNSVKE